VGVSPRMARSIFGDSLEMSQAVPTKKNFLKNAFSNDRHMSPSIGIKSAIRGALMRRSKDANPAQTTTTMETKTKELPHRAP
jgi:hypothetical protein